MGIAATGCDRSVAEPPEPPKLYAGEIQITEFSEAFVRATYPNLSPLGLQYSATKHGQWYGPRYAGSVHIQVDSKLVDIRTADDLDKVLLYVMLQFDARGLKAVTTYGTAVSSTRQVAVEQGLSDGRGWTRSTILARLKALGAICLDENAVQQGLPREQWRRLFGEVRFDRPALYLPEPENRGFPGIGTWKTKLTAARPRSTYSVSIEPWGGLITSMYRRD